MCVHVESCINRDCLQANHKMRWKHRSASCHRQMVNNEKCAECLLNDGDFEMLLCQTAYDGSIQCKCTSFVRFAMECWYLLGLREN